ncbi:MAG TPA: transglycosylase SLT domain-containing protein [Thermoanaerobaculia bacterium]
MEAIPSSVQDSGRLRTPAAKAAWIGFAGFFALALPVGGSRSGDLSASSAPVSSPDLSTLPNGWPGPVPEVDDEHSLQIWNAVYRQCQRFAITDQAISMYQVIWEESRLKPKVVSPCGLYEGISQFLGSTFRRNVRAMKRLDLIPKDAKYNPFDPDQAIEVMAWMWSQGYSSHWGPYRRVSRRLEGEAVVARLTN